MIFTNTVVTPVLVSVSNVTSSTVPAIAVASWKLGAAKATATCVKIRRPANSMLVIIFAFFMDNSGCDATSILRTEDHACKNLSNNHIQLCKVCLRYSTLFDKNFSIICNLFVFTSVFMREQLCQTNHHLIYNLLADLACHLNPIHIQMKRLAHMDMEICALQMSQVFQEIFATPMCDR